MSDWAVGDLAVCVDDGPRRHYAVGAPWPMKAGSVWRVSMVGADQLGRIFLRFDDQPPTFSPLGYATRRFRKVLHDEPKACEEEFQTLLDRSKVTAFDMMGGPR